jgi:urea carboxylase-associated protein 2
VDDLDQASPEEHRARYERLKSSASARNKARPGAAAPGPVADSDVQWRERIPPGGYTTVRVGRGRRLRLTDEAGGASVTFMAWNAAQPSERYNAGDTVKLQWTARLSIGHALFSDMGRVLGRIVADTAAGHDALIGASTRAAGRRAGAGEARNGRDNLVLAAAKFGLGVADVPTPLAFFADLRTDEAGRFVWGDASAPGAEVEIACELDLLVALSNTAHPFDPRPRGGAVTAIVWAGDGADVGASGEEVGRGLENNARYLSELAS